jgi:hypothetical protein
MSNEYYRRKIDEERQKARAAIDALNAHLSSPCDCNNEAELDRHLARTHQLERERDRAYKAMDYWASNID